MKHYIIFFRTNAHCAVFTVCAPSLAEAMATYSVKYRGAERLEDGSLKTGDGYGGQIIYSHPLECFESEEKADGWNGNTTEIRELLEADLNKPFAEPFWSADPDWASTSTLDCGEKVYTPTASRGGFSVLTR